jgi:hypothetical protein
VTVPNGDAIDLYENPETGAYVKAVVDPKGDYEATIHVLSYVDGLPGKKIIGSYRYGTDSGSYTFTKIEPNVAISDADLHPPAPTATWSFVNPNPFPIHISSTRIFVDATINGIRGFGPLSERTDVVKLATLDVGGNTLSNVSALVDHGNMDFTHFDTDGGVDGLIGFDLRGGALLTLNTEHSTMTIAVSDRQRVFIPVDDRPVHRRGTRLPEELQHHLRYPARADGDDAAQVARRY